MSRVEQLRSRLRLPVIVAPMFLVSGPELVIASCAAGLVGSFPAANARTIDVLDDWMRRITRAVGDAPWALNLVVHPTYNPLFPEQMDLLDDHRPPIVITSLGQPGDVVQRVHAYGGLVFHDVTTLRHAEKAIEAGVDGLILVTAGAGGHCGDLHPFVFVPQIRQHWDGAVLLAGAIGDGAAILASEALGADFAYMGTRFAATQESSAADEYKQLLLGQGAADIVVTDRISGVQAAFMRGSLTRVGLDPDNLPPLRGPRRPDLPDHVKPWRDAWSAGQVVGLIDDIPTVAGLVDRLEHEYQHARDALCRDAGTPQR